MTHILKKFWWLWLIIIIIPATILYLAHRDQARYTVLSDIQKRGELIVVTRNAPTTYYETHAGQFAGIEYDMVIAFADHLGVKPRFIIKHTIDEILATITNGEADLAAAGLTITDMRNKHFIFGPGYQSVYQQVVCRSSDKALPKSLADLNSYKLAVSAKTSYAERLWELQHEHPLLKWEQNPDWDTELLLEKVSQHKIDCTIADSNIFAINQRYYPELKQAFPLTDEAPLAWAMLKNARHLQGSVENWFDEFKNQGTLELVMNRYYGYLDKFDYVDTKKFKKRIKQRLPKYKKWFKQAARKHKLDWILLAAQSYQESHWNRRAKSPTGVRGIMMLTQPTARQLGVKSRLDPKPNIFAGAKYLAQLRKRIPDHIREPDRTWMALAAYNLGYGHLTDARGLAQKLDKNPDHWIELEEVLPCLRKKYHNQLKHGYARGGEAVYYVKQIRDYRDILSEVYRK